MPALLLGLKTLGLNIVVSLATEKFLKWALFASARALAKSTKTGADDELVNEVEKAYDTNITKGL